MFLLWTQEPVLPSFMLVAARKTYLSTLPSSEFWQQLHPMKILEGIKVEMTLAQLSEIQREVCSRRIMNLQGLSRDKMLEHLSGWVQPEHYKHVQVNKATVADLQCISTMVSGLSHDASVSLDDLRMAVGACKMESRMLCSALYTFESGTKIGR